jgi:hypothetical protein
MSIFYPPTAKNKNAKKFVFFDAGVSVIIRKNKKVTGEHGPIGPG